MKNIQRSVFEIKVLFCALLACIHIETVRPGFSLCTPLVYCSYNRVNKCARRAPSALAGLDKSGVRTPGTTIKRCWATRSDGLVAQRTTKIFCKFFRNISSISPVPQSMQ